MIFKVQSTVIMDISVRCTLGNIVKFRFYKYCGALHQFDHLIIDTLLNQNLLYFFNHLLNNYYK
jgi:hypothetical protein